MANRSEGFNERLTIAAIALAAFAILLWVVPCSLDGSGTRMHELFSGLTDFGLDYYRGRMPAFIVAAFSSIFLLQLRRR